MLEIISDRGGRRRQGLTRVGSHKVLTLFWMSVNRPEYDIARGNNGPSIFDLPFSLSEVASVTHFVARREELAQMHAILGKTGERRTVILHGLGGMGKTQLAIAYMRRHRADYSAALWLNARDQTSLKQSFARAAERILRQYPSLVYIKNAVADRDLDEIVQAVKRWLDEPKNDRWLVIYDNYDNPRLGARADEDNSIGHVLGSGLDERVRATSQTDIAASKAFDIRPFLSDHDCGAILVTTRSSVVNIGQQVRLRKLRDIHDSLKILASTSNRQDLNNGNSTRKHRL